MIRRLAPAAALLVAACLALAGCRPVPEPSLTPPAETSNPDVAVTADIEYRSEGGTPLTLDVCRPAEPAGALPTILLLHGGGFEAGDKSAMRSLCERFAENGAAAVSVQYRLLPDYHFPAQVEDVAAAVAWVGAPENAEEYGFDPARIGVLGSSAGAIIAMSVGVGMGGAPVAAVVALSGAADLTESGLRLGVPAKQAQEIVLGYLGCEDIRACPTAQDASPLLHVTATSAPMLLLAGSDELVPSAQSVAMRDALRAAGVASEVLVEEGTNHGLALLSSDNLRIVQDFFLANL
ncbi:alpha/beta hydrolase [Naasia sp. SYSU D00948]|uniref:alpha/beta hydrolase n=1 Tax=Naasia sp. SYSU D00948 TaxID=2817379 RepID=UPI001B304F36|nr:alpha/beta hydrolase [Naasia sp. SYSU D00948]